MRINSEWGGQMEITAMSHLYGRTIVLYNGPSQQMYSTIFPDNSEPERIHLLYHRGCHYKAAVNARHRRTNFQDPGSWEDRRIDFLTLPLNQQHFEEQVRRQASGISSGSAMDLDDQIMELVRRQSAEMFERDRQNISDESVSRAIDSSLQQEFEETTRRAINESKESGGIHGEINTGVSGPPDVDEELKQAIRSSLTDIPTPSQGEEDQVRRALSESQRMAEEAGFQSAWIYQQVVNHDSYDAELQRALYESTKSEYRNH